MKYLFPLCSVKCLVILCCCGQATAGFAQAGCTDPQATNFDAGVTQNDGSCLYPATYYVPTFQANVAGALKEISGLHYADGEWWAHNDSGYDPELFSLNPQTGVVLKTIELKDANNRDWEDICSDGVGLYIGDFGNNDNDRQNMGIYRVPFSAIGNGSSQTVNQDEYNFIPFAYPDQVDFTTVPEDSTVFDCEAMIFAQNKLHLFTKNRLAYQTTHYVLDPVTSVVEKRETFDVQGLITGASMSPDGEVIALAGYDLRGLPTVFCWLLWDWPAGTDQYFSGNKRRIELGSALSVGQVESIGFLSDRGGYIANERTEYNGFLFVQQTTRTFDFSEYIPQSVPTSQPDMGAQQLHLFPNPCPGTLHLSVDAGQPEPVALEVINQLGERVLQVKGMPENLDVLLLPAGIYYLQATWPGGGQSWHKLLR